ncbi:MAG: HAD-IIIC family phosphatase [Solirubrobacteraceae bacterium]
MSREPQGRSARRRGRVKCVVWDLDNTVWDGVLVEDREVRLRPEIVALIEMLDARGILHSVASRNDHDLAMSQIDAFGLSDYFLYPQISWNSKSEAITAIANSLNIGLDAIAFVDDQVFELEEVAFVHPDVLCLGVDALDGILRFPEFWPRFITDESRQRRAMYRSAIARDTAEQEFRGTNEAFLRTLDMVLTIASAAEEDLQRAEELTVRTNQLNSTGITYSYDELDRYRTSPDHMLLVAGLTDKYGAYGKIGIALVDTGSAVWRLKLLLMSCRVMSRGVGNVMLHHIADLARHNGAGLEADFVETGRNRMMYITYRFGGFTEVRRQGATAVLRADLDQIRQVPSYVRLETQGVPA